MLCEYTVVVYYPSSFSLF